jgi:DUF1009 family protein
MARKLAILAGRGPLPAQVAAAALAQGAQVFVLAFEGETDPDLVRELPHRWVPLGAVGRAIDVLRAAKVEEVVLIGPVRRPAAPGSPSVSTASRPWSTPTSPTGRSRRRASP